MIIFWYLYDSMSITIGQTELIYKEVSSILDLIENKTCKEAQPLYIIA